MNDHDHCHHHHHHYHHQLSIFITIIIINYHNHHNQLLSAREYCLSIRAQWTFPFHPLYPVATHSTTRYCMQQDMFMRGYLQRGEWNTFYCTLAIQVLLHVRLLGFMQARKIHSILTLTKSEIQLRGFVLGKWILPENA